MPFFDAADENDLQLLPRATRKEPDIVTLASMAEAEVLAAYTVRHDAGALTPAQLASGSNGFDVSRAYLLDAAYGVYICLRGYDPDPLACPPALAAAIKHEIAGVIRHLAAQWAESPLTDSESASDGKKSKGFRADKNRRLPEGFGRFLAPYSVRPPALAI